MLANGPRAGMPNFIRYTPRWREVSGWLSAHKYPLERKSALTFALELLGSAPVVC
jgi:hypothetical protein